MKDKKASAPGLSDVDRAIIQGAADFLRLRGFNCYPDALESILTRASAATVAEASDKLDAPAQVSSAQRDLKVCLADAQRTVSTTKKALSDLMNAVRWWGAQEDGIPTEVAPSFNAAHLALGWSLSHPTDFKAAAQQSKQNSAHEWNSEGERCLKCGDKDWFAGSTCSGKAAQSGQRAGVAELSPEQQKQIAWDAHIKATLIPGANLYTSAQMAVEATVAAIAAAPTQQQEENK